MNIFDSLILGTIQGLTEILPISSSGHLVLLPWLFKFKDPGLAFDVFLHLGTTVALIAFFWKDLFNICKGLLSIIIPKINYSMQDKKLGIMILIGTIPAALAGYFGEKYFENLFRHPLSVAFFLIVFGLVMFYVDKKIEHTKDMSSLSIGKVFFIGCAQALALIPGISRSGVTIVAGIILGLKKEDAARFSFLLSAPTIVGATMLKSKDILKLGLEKGSMGYLLIGFLSSMILGYFAIKFLLEYLKTHSLNLFVYYRIGLGILIISLFFMK
jgi:undecaprenyl-diphosphatase